MRFSWEDQRKFAALSGDFNPRHMDPVRARRFIFGRPVVHGVNLVMCGLNLFLKKIGEPIFLSSLKADFLSPVFIDSETKFQFFGENATGVTIGILDEIGVVASISIGFNKGISENLTIPDFSFEPQEPELIASGEISEKRGVETLSCDFSEIEKYYPSISRNISRVQIAELLATTRIIGMKCPGMNSVFQEMDLSFRPIAEKPTPEITYEAIKFESRFSLLSISISGPSIKGVLKAFVSPDPIRQPGISDVSRIVQPDRFSGQRSLIIGGGRGIGEVTSKILAAGGASVCLTYCAGASDAQRVVDELRLFEKDAAHFKFDVTHPDFDMLRNECKNFSPSHLYYFATPYISSTRKGSFSQEQYNKFSEFYVYGFVKLVQFFKKNVGSCRRFLYPSTIFLEEVPGNFGEYIAAKSAGEITCRWLMKCHPEIRIFSPRLPRFQTDQTSGFTHGKFEDVISIMYENIRAFQSY